MFVWDKKDLNDEQTSAVLNENNVLLVACPGSGKTRTLTYKVAYELSKLDNSKQYIIAITYTNRAADEIKERIELLGVDTKQLWIGTIHAFCLEWILRPYSQYEYRLKNGFRVIDSYESEKVIKLVCEEYNNQNNLSGRDRITYWDCTFLATPKPGIKMTSTNELKKNGIKSILTEYFKRLRENNQIDFEQILCYSLKLLKDNVIICSILSKLFPIILVDEYQDTKEIQYHIIGSILRAISNNTRMFMVGDPNQSIYQTLGAYPIEKDELEQISGLEIELLELDKNYRSSKKIIEYFSHFKSFDNSIVPFGKNTNYESLITLNASVDRDDLIHEISRLIQKNVNDLSIIPEEICIVAPQWVHIAGITRKLMLALPNYNFDGPGMAPFARDIENFWFKISRIVLTEPSPNLYIIRLRWANEILKELMNIGVNIEGTNAKGFLKYCNSIDCHETNGLLYLKYIFMKISNFFSFNIEFYPQLQEHFDAFFLSSQNRIIRLIKEGFDFIEHIDSFKKVFKQRNGITVSTIHGIKGAEYDVVIAFALLNDYIPHWSDRNGYENSKKMLYVISSRARKNLYLIAERGRINNGIEHKITDHLKNFKYRYDNNDLNSLD